MQLWSGSNQMKQQQQQNQAVERGSWLLPEQQQQQQHQQQHHHQQQELLQPAPLAGLDAWLPGRRSVSPTHTALCQSTSTALAHAGCTSHRHHIQQIPIVSAHMAGWLHSSPKHEGQASKEECPWHHQQLQQQQQQQQQQRLAAQSKQQLWQQQQHSSQEGSPTHVNHVPGMQQPSIMQQWHHYHQQQQQSGGRLGGSPSAAARGAGAASIARRATVSKTLADMQQQYDQEQRQQEALLAQQQHMHVQPWLQDKQSPQREQYRHACGSNRVISSPGKLQALAGCPTHQWQQLPSLQSPAKQGPISTAIRVSTAGAQAVLSPPNTRVPVEGGCVDVYQDGVEVRSSKTLVISVCSSPGPEVQGAAAATPTARTPAAQLGSSWLAARSSV
jgi:hypothetical protein